LFVFIADHYDLEHPDWRYDAIPEIMDGLNIADYYEPEIATRLAELEAEEEQRLAELAALDKGDEKVRHLFHLPQ